MKIVKIYIFHSKEGGMGLFAAAEEVRLVISTLRTSLNLKLRCHIYSVLYQEIKYMYILLQFYMYNWWNKNTEYPVHV